MHRKQGEPVTQAIHSMIKRYPGTVVYTKTANITDVSKRGQRDYLRLAAARAMPTGMLQQQLWYLALARLIDDTLRDSGRDLTVEGFADGLMSRYNYSTDWGPNLSFTPGRHTGVSSEVVLRTTNTIRN